MDTAKTSPSIEASPSANCTQTPGSSRSTSAGSSLLSPGSCDMASSGSSPAKEASKQPVPTLPEYSYPTPFLVLDGKGGGEGQDGSPALPEGDYPAPVVIKNTFLDSPNDPTESLEGFFQEREIRSCPPGAMVPPGLKLLKVHEKLPDVEEEDSRADSTSHAGTDTVSHAGTNSISLGFADIEYPSMVIKNTFIDSPASQPTSLDNFLQDRETRSAPGSGLVGPPGLRRNEIAEQSRVIDTPLNSAMYEQPMITGDALRNALEKATSPDKDKEPAPVPAVQQSQVLSTPFPSAMYEQPMISADATYAGASLKAAGEPPMPPPPSEQAPSLEPVAGPPPPPAVKADEARPLKVVRIADALPTPELGSAEMPTVGSAGHRLGTCKPCAFMHTKGCTNGQECPFCHLCAPGERKRRQKQKLAQAAREQQQVSLWDSLQDNGGMAGMAAPR